MPRSQVRVVGSAHPPVSAVGSKWAPTMGRAEAGTLGEHYVRKLCAALRGQVVCGPWNSAANVRAGTAKGIGDYTAGSHQGMPWNTPRRWAAAKSAATKAPTKATAEWDVPGFMQPFSRWLAWLGRLANCGMWPPCTLPIER